MALSLTTTIVDKGRNVRDSLYSLPLPPLPDKSAYITYRLFGRRRDGFSLDVGITPHGNMTWIVYDERKDSGVIFTRSICYNQFREEPLFTESHFWGLQDARQDFIREMETLLAERNLLTYLQDAIEAVKKTSYLVDVSGDEVREALELDSSSFDEVVMSGLRRFFAPILSERHIDLEKTSAWAAIESTFPVRERVYQIYGPPTEEGQHEYYVEELGWHPQSGMPWLIHKNYHDREATAMPISWGRANRFLYFRGRLGESHSFLALQPSPSTGLHLLHTGNTFSHRQVKGTELISAYYYRADSFNPGIILQRSATEYLLAGRPVMRGFCLLFATFPLWLTEEKAGALHPLPDALSQQHIEKLFGTRYSDEDF